MHCRSCFLSLASLLSANAAHLAKPLQGGGRVSLDGQHPAVSMHQQQHPLAVVPHILRQQGGVNLWTGQLFSIITRCASVSQFQKESSAHDGGCKDKFVRHCLPHICTFTSPPPQASASGTSTSVAVAVKQDTVPTCVHTTAGRMRFWGIALRTDGTQRLEGQHRGLVHQV